MVGHFFWVRHLKGGWGGDPPKNILKNVWNILGHPEKRTPQWLPMTPIFYSKILLYYQNEVVYKKLDRKISNIGRMASIFVWSQIFKIIRKILKIFISAHMHARNGLKSCVHSYLCIKIIFYFHDNSQICIHLWLSGGASEPPPLPVGQWESDMPWEVGLSWKCDVEWYPPF